MIPAHVAMEPLHPLLPHEGHLVDEEKFGSPWQSHSKLEKSSPTTSSRPPTWSWVFPWSLIVHRLDPRRRSISRTRHVLPHTIRCKCTILRLLVKTAILVALLFLSVSVWISVFCPSYASPPQRYRDLTQRVTTSAEPGRGNVNNEKIFIAANILNEDLIRGEWGQNLLSLIDLLGHENVFVSIYENDSGVGTSDALRQLQQSFKCNSSVVTGDHVPLSHFPRTQLPDGEERVQRLTYLSEIRNRLLRPIDPSYHAASANGFRKATGVHFDKILFLNDVYYSPLEAVQLLFSTNAASGRAEYRAACAIDFVQLFKMYDSFVVRDTDGYRVALQFFPWFTYRGSGTSRADILSITDAVKVRSCWGGMAAFDASIFQPRQTSISNASGQNGGQLTLKFRSNGEPFWEAAECCLIFADMEEKFGIPSKHDGTGVFLNPYIRTAYSPTTWKWLPTIRRFERIFEKYQFIVDLFKPPEWNPRRTHEPGQYVDEVVWVDSNSTSLSANPHYRNYAEMNQHGHFEVQHRAAGVGGFCGERRMFVMKKDIGAANKDYLGKNWENIHVPWHYEVNGP